MMFLTIMISLALLGKELTIDKMEITNDTVYEKGVQEPFTGVVRESGKNGKLQTEKNYKNGRLDGITKIYYENGEINKEENYLDNKLDGVIKSYYEDGKLFREEIYKNNILNGIVKTYYKTNILQDERNYKNNKLDGKSKLYNINGKLKVEEIYVNGKLDGISRTYDDSGKILIESIYKDGVLADKKIPKNQSELKNGILYEKVNNIPYTGIVLSYFPDGKLSKEETYYSGILDGPQKMYYKDGITIKIEGNFLDGYGKIREYYDNSNTIKSEKEIRNDILEGIEKEYYENGKVKSEINWDKTKHKGIKKETNEAGETKQFTEIYWKMLTESNTNALFYESESPIPYTGIAKSWYPNGQIKLEYGLKDGKYEGTYKNYYENGNLFSVGITKNNGLDGEYVQYYENEQVALKENYKNGYKDGEFTEYYINGQTKQEYTCKDGKIEGIYKIYYEDGNTQSETTYENGIKNGVFKVYYESGNESKIGNYLNNKEEGEINEYYSDGSKKSITNYKNGKLEGKKEGYYEKSGQLSYEESYIEGELEGKRIIYFADGNMSIEENYKTGKIDGNKVEYYSDGTVKIEEKYKDGNLDGIRKEWYENGQIKLEERYRTANLDGIKKEYHKNGILKFEGKYIDGKAEGAIKTYYENEKLKSEINYKYGVKDGIEREFYANGALSYEVNYKKDKREGISKGYYENGILKIEGYYKAGNGVERTYYKDSKLSAEDNYINNKKDGISRKYSEKGDLIAEENYKDGKKEGLSKNYNDKGVLLAEDIYKDDYKNGICKKYGEDGKLESEETYSNDMKEGIAKYYNKNGNVKTEVIYVRNKKGVTTEYDENGKLLYVTNWINNKDERVDKWFTNYNLDKLETQQNKTIREALFVKIIQDKNFKKLFDAIWKESKFTEEDKSAFLAAPYMLSSFTMVQPNMSDTSPYVAIFNIRKPNGSWVKFAFVVPAKFSYGAKGWNLNIPYEKSSDKVTEQIYNWTRFWDDDKKEMKSLVISANGENVELKDTNEKTNWLVRGLVDITEHGPIGGCEYSINLRKYFGYNRMAPTAQYIELGFDEYGNGYAPNIERAKAENQAFKKNLIGQLYNIYLPGEVILDLKNRKMSIQNYGYMLEQSIVAEGELTPKEMRRFAYERREDPSLAYIYSGQADEVIYILQFKKDDGSWIKAAFKVPDRNQKLYPEDIANLTRVWSDREKTMKSIVFKGANWTEKENRMELIKTNEKVNMILVADVDISREGPCIERILPQPSWAVGNYTKEYPEAAPGYGYDRWTLREIEELNAAGGPGIRARNDDLRKKYYNNRK
jgi:antitoxin component YwqK of YwqJK toxin-antitoxin module